MPLLVIHGSIDKLTAPSGSRDLVARAGGTDKRFELYEGLNHDLLHEPDGGAERVTADVLAWLDAHTGGAALAPAAGVTGRLKGDRGAGAAAVEFDLRGEQARDADDLGGEPALTGGLRLRLGFGRVGWHGGLDLRTGVEDGWRYEADAYPLGLAVRLGRSGQLALVGGIGAGGVRGRAATRVPVELSLELPLGPVHLASRVALAWRLSGDAYEGDALGLADEASAFLGVRLGRDRRYWADVVAGGGPFIGLGWRDLGGTQLIGVTLGVALWGSN